MSERAIQNGYLIAAQSDIENLRARIAALEEVVRAADSTAEATRSALASCRRNELDGWEIGVIATRLNDYDSKRRALGEIGD